MPFLSVLWTALSSVVIGLVAGAILTWINSQWLKFPVSNPKANLPKGGYVGVSIDWLLTPISLLLIVIGAVFVHSLPLVIIGATVGSFNGLLLGTLEVKWKDKKPFRFPGFYLVLLLIWAIVSAWYVQH